jgi:predicted nucleic acid-binding protein
MRYLLDTNVLSELMKPVPDAKVVNWLFQQRDQDVWVSALAMGETERGILLMDEGKRRDGFLAWFNRLQLRYSHQTLGLDSKSFRKWALLYGIPRYKKGVDKVMYSLIAASAFAHGFVLVTRNVDDMPKAVPVLNPWEV